MSFRATSLFTLLAIVATCVAGITMADRSRASKPEASIPPNAIRVASGKFGNDRVWSIWLYGGRKHGSCWVTHFRNGKSVEDTTHCGFSVPEHTWQLAAMGSSGPGHRSKSMLFFLTQPSVALLKVSVRTSRGVALVPFSVQQLSKRQANRSHLPMNFGYASSGFPGEFQCIRSLSAVERSGHIVKRARHPGC